MSKVTTLRAGEEEIYVSTDIECDGLVPGWHSMLSLGSAAFTADGELLRTFSANLEPLPDCEPLAITMQWWQSYPEAWAQCQVDPRPPARVIAEFARWVLDLPGQPVFVGYPAVFDFGFVSYYLARFTRGNPFGFAALDIRSFAMALTGKAFLATTKESMPAAWVTDRPHSHVALDDAIEQGEWFCNMLRLSRLAATA